MSIEDINVIDKYTLIFNSIFARSNKKRYYIAIGASISFTIIITISTILIVCLTSPKSRHKCQSTIQTLIPNHLLELDSSPCSIVTGDLDHNNKLDLIVANSGANTIGILLNYDNQNFISPITITTGIATRPVSVALGDFDNNTHLDIAVANYDTHNIGIFLGHGNGSFARQISFSTGPSRPMSLAVHDLNKDHRLDIIAANNGTHDISIFLGYGNGSFQNGIVYSTGYDSLPSFVAIRDLNNDHNQDIIVANYGTNNIGIFLGYGNGTFASQRTYSTGIRSSPSSISINDLNNDGQLDIAVANTGTNSVGIFLGYGNGTFESQMIYSTYPGSYPQSIIVGDFNQDNQLDIAVSNRNTNNISILLGYDDGNFAKPEIHSTGTDSVPFALAVGDFDDDNQSDIAVAKFRTNNILVLIGYVMTRSENPTAYSTSIGSIPYQIASGDVNNDTYLDLIVTNSGTGTLGVFISYGNGSFHEQVTYPSVHSADVRGLVLIDLDHDQQLDIVVTNFNDETIGILFGYGNGSFSPVITYSTESPSAPVAITINDFNNDNHLDIVFSDRVTSHIGIFLGYGNRTFGKLTRFRLSNGSVLLGIASGDFNEDNNVDVAVCDYGTGNVEILLGSGTGNFTSFTRYSTGDASHVSAITLADLNYDHHLDFVVSNSATDNIGVFFGFGNGSFTHQQSYSTGASSGSIWVSIADFDNDGWLDLAVANSLANNVGILLGDGQGNFGNQTTYLTGPTSKPYSIAVADFNQDNRLDIAVANYGSHNVAILLGHPIKNSSNQTTISIINNERTDNRSILLGNYYADFTSKINYPLGSSSRPYSFVIGDLNNDTYMDIIVSDSGNENLNIHLGYNNINYATKLPYSIGVDAIPKHIVIDDFNRDNRLDLALIDGNDGSIVVLLGNGYGTFLTKLIYPTDFGSDPSALAVGDINNDMYLDLIVTNMGKDTIGIFLGLNYTIFERQDPCDVGSDSSPNAIALGDFNNDGHLDIVTSLYYWGNVAVLLGFGNGSFTPLTTYSDMYQSQPRAITIGDVNNDNNLDIIEVKRGINSIAILLGHGNGTFSKPLLFSCGPNTHPRSVAVGDFNHDNYLDITVANNGANTVGVFFGYGNGSFQDVIAMYTGKSSRPTSVSVFDLNKDTYPDIIVVNLDSSQVGVFLSYGNKNFSSQISFSTGTSSSPMFALAQDFDKDGKVDLAIANFGTNQVLMLYAYENDTFANSRSYSTTTDLHPEQLDVGDFNNDQHLDIIVIGTNSRYVGVFFGYNDGTFSSISLISLEKSASRISYVAIGDLNHDSHLDIALADYGYNDIQIYLANGTKPFTGQTVSYDVGQGSRPSELTTGYFNNDSYLDIAVTNYGSNSISILLGYGRKTFSNVRRYSTGENSHPLSLVVADFNNDSRLDIIVANSNTNNVVIFIGLGNGEFFILTTYSMGDGSSPLSIAEGDFNRDYKKDIVVANFGTNNICILFGLDNGTFTNQTWYPLGYDSRPRWIVFKDLNHDNWKDIAVATFGIGNIHILLNLC